MSSFFTALSNIVQSSNYNAGTRRFNQNKVFPAQVVDIILNETHPGYESPRDIGKILFRDLATERGLEESSNTIKKTAYPLDRSFIRMPFPGEEVLVFRAIGEAAGAVDYNVFNGYWYTFVVSVLNNVTYNGHPWIGVTYAKINPLGVFQSYIDAKKRFEKKILDLELIKTDDKLHVYKQLRPHEGDFILQGRFGNTIRMGGSSTKMGTPTLTSPTTWGKQGGIGSGIMMLRVDQTVTDKDTDMLTEEDINKDNVSVYLCTSQLIVMDLACSKKGMRTWKYAYGIDEDVIGNEPVADEAKMYGRILKDDGMVIPTNADNYGRVTPTSTSKTYERHKRTI